MVLAGLCLSAWLMVPASGAVEDGSKQPTAPGKKVLSKEAFKELRKAAANKKRRIIFNNDGDDALAVHSNMPATAENLLKLRTTPLVGSQVDAIFYCSIQNIAETHHRTKVGKQLTASSRDFARYKEGEKCLVSKEEVKRIAQYRNITGELAAQGTDPLQIMLEFGRSHNIEVFCSMRMNDCHDCGHRPDNPYPGFSRFKQEHPECLVGSRERPPPGVPWSTLDYGQPAVRDMVFLLLEEVCRDYDVYGIELDFYRNPTFFKSVCWGAGKQWASQAELDLMTDLMRRIHAMTETEGLKKGKPILLSVRVPDSVDYCRAIGLDLEKWLAEGLVDLLTVGDYFQLNPWEYSVRLGRKYGVPVYACFSCPAVKEGKPQAWPQDFRRGSPAFLRGAVMQAWHSGVDGIYTFNHFNPHAALWREVGDPKELMTRDKVYFMAPRGVANNTTHHFYKLEEFRHVPTLCVEKPISLSSNETRKMTMVMAEDFPGAEKRGLNPEVFCHLWVKGMAEGDRVDVKMNGRLLENVKVAGESLSYRIERSDVKNGENVFEIIPRIAPRMKDNPVDLQDFIVAVGPYRLSEPKGEAYAPRTDQPLVPDGKAGKWAGTRGIELALK